MMLGRGALVQLLWSQLLVACWPCGDAFAWHIMAAHVQSQCLYEALSVRGLLGKPQGSLQDATLDLEKRIITHPFHLLHVALQTTTKLWLV